MAFMVKKQNSELNVKKYQILFNKIQIENSIIYIYHFQIKEILLL